LLKKKYIKSVIILRGMVLSKKLKDKRSKLWAVLEKEIQSRARNKDESFRLSGKWKKFIGKRSGHKIYSVDGRRIRNNLCAYFGHGGHGLVHEFIPLDEIWVSSHHYNEGDSKIAHCNCKIKRNNHRVSKKFFESTLIHELTECEEMKKGKPYWEAHQVALQKEKEIGLLSESDIIRTIRII